MSKIKISKSELLFKITEQITMLKTYCNLFDNGNTVFSSKIALCIRVLLHNTKNCCSAYEQLKREYNLKNFLFPDSRGVNYLVDTREIKHKYVSSLLYEYNAEVMDNQIAIKIKHKTVRKYNFWSFEDWWTKVSAISWRENNLSRKDIICLLADQDGGAHIDTSIDNRLYEIKHSIPPKTCIVINSYSFTADTEELFYCVIRTIAEEVIYVFENKIIPSCK